jgi:hypothetical protein
MENNFHEVDGVYYLCIMSTNTKGGEDLILVEARPSLFCYVERHGLVFAYRRFGTTRWFYF